MTLDQLQALFRQHIGKAESEFAWYGRRKWRWSAGSCAIKTLAFLIVVCAALAPFAAGEPPLHLGFLEFANPGQVSLALVALAGFVIGADQVFLVTGTWTRYMQAMTRIRTSILAAELEWLEITAAFGSPPSVQDTQRALAFLRTFTLGIREIVASETSAWGAELAAAVAHMKSLLDAQKGAAEALVKEAQHARAPTQTAVRVRITGHADRLAGQVACRVGDREERKDVPLEAFVFLDVPPGLQRVALAGRDGQGRAIEVDDVVTVVAGTISEAAINIP